MGIFEKFKLGFKKSAENITLGLKEIIIKKKQMIKLSMKLRNF